MAADPGEEAPVELGDEEPSPKPPDPPEDRPGEAEAPVEVYDPVPEPGDELNPWDVDFDPPAELRADMPLIPDIPDVPLIPLSPDAPLMLIPDMPELNPDIPEAVDPAPFLPVTRVFTIFS